MHTLVQYFTLSSGIWKFVASLHTEKPHHTVAFAIKYSFLKVITEEASLIVIQTSVLSVLSFHS